MSNRIEWRKVLDVLFLVLMVTFFVTVAVLIGVLLWNIATARDPAGLACQVDPASQACIDYRVDQCVQTERYSFDQCVTLVSRAGK